MESYIISQKEAFTVDAHDGKGRRIQGDFATQREMLLASSPSPVSYP